MKKILYLISTITMSLCLVTGCANKENINNTFVPTSTTYNKNQYGEEAYSYLQFIDKNLIEREAGSKKELSAGNYIMEELKNFGYEVRVEPFFYLKGLHIKRSRNIIVTKPGDTSKEIVVGAHYDSAETTHGVDDNGSGVSVVLETAKRLIKTKTQYTIKFVFFGAEEVGTKGSNSYVKKHGEKDDILCFINLDSICAGDIPYIYGGNYNTDKNKITEAWAVEQAKTIADELNLGVQLNPGLNKAYPTPVAGDWGDHVAFKNAGIPYIYCEASNWNIGDLDGFAETEKEGTIMHNEEKDNLAFIQNAFPGRSEKTLAIYSQLLPELITKLKPEEGTN